MSPNEQNELLQFMYQAPVGLMQTDCLGAIKFSTPMAAQLLMPLSPTGGLGNVFDALDRTAPELRNNVISFKKKRGRIVTDYRCVAVDATGETIAALGVTIVKLAADKLAVAIADLRSLLEQEDEALIRGQMVAALGAAADGCEMCVVDEAGRIAEWSDAGEGPSGVNADAIVGQPLSVLVVDEDRNAMTGGDVDNRAAAGMREHIVTSLLDRAAQTGVATSEGLRARQNGDTFWAETTVTKLTDSLGRAAGFAVVTRDVGEERARQKALIEMAARDPLTGALNRRAFFSIARSVGDGCEASNCGFAIAIADIDRFKRLNDEHGHQVGDEALKAFVATTNALLRPGEQIGRLGGEEFVFLLPAHSAADAVGRAEEIRRATEAIRVPSDGGEVTFTTSVGVAAWNGGDETLSQLIERADEALYVAKERGRNRVIAASFEQEQQSA